MSQSPRTKAKQLREPPPSLFLGPPSQNASHVSLPGTSTPLAPTLSSPLNPTTAARAPILRQRSERMQNRPTFDGPQDSMTLPRGANVLPRQHQENEGKKQADRTDALWAEMQSTLEEVELSAVNGTRVFGPEHNRALEALREAQIGLAQAWARSEADDAVESREEGKSGGAGNTETVVSGSRSERPGSSEVGPDTRNIGTQLEQETEGDILLARQRREANDRYFSRVNSGVLDVVAKLEDVATAMKAVEQESRDIWGDNESILGGSAMTSIHGQ